MQKAYNYTDLFSSSKHINLQSVKTHSLFFTDDLQQAQCVGQTERLQQKKVWAVGACQTSPPVRTARSAKFALLLSPKPGAFTAQTYRVYMDYNLIFRTKDIL